MMMAGSSTHYPQQPPVISPQFVLPYPVDLAVVRKTRIFQEDKFEVVDIDGNIKIKIKSKSFSLRNRLTLLDAADNPILTLQPKMFSAHGRWEAFRGQSTEARDLLFSMKEASLFQMKTKLHVFLGGNTKEDACDFYIKGSWRKKSCMVYAGDSSAIIAQMHKKNSAVRKLVGKYKFGITVYPNVDYAFIVALIVILQEMKKPATTTTQAQLNNFTSTPPA